jgi:hypothetical protein
MSEVFTLPFIKVINGDVVKGRGCGHEKCERCTVHKQTFRGVDFSVWHCCRCGKFIPMRKVLCPDDRSVEPRELRVCARWRTV